MLIEQQQITERFFSSAFLADELFCRLSPETENALRSVKQEKEFGKNETVFARGEMPCSILLALEGEAQVFLKGGEFVHRVQPNEILGLTEAISNLPYEISLKTVTECRFEVIRREDFIRFLEDNPEICFRLLEMLGANLYKLYRLFR